MAFSSETTGRLLASGRNYVGQIIAFAGGIGVMSAAQQKSLSEGLGQVIDGIMMVIHGGATMWTVLAVVAAPIIGPILARWASNTAKTSNQATAVKTSVEESKASGVSLPLDVKATIVDATAALPEVVGDIKVTDKALELATESNQVKAAA